MSSIQGVHPPCCDTSVVPSPVVSGAVAPFFADFEATLLPCGVAVLEFGCVDAWNLRAHAPHLDTLSRLLYNERMNASSSVMTHRRPCSSHGPRLGPCNRGLPLLKLRSRREIWHQSWMGMRQNDKEKQHNGNVAEGDELSCHGLPFGSVPVARNVSSHVPR